MSQDLLFELGTEELPSGSVWPLGEALANQLVKNLDKAGLSHGEVRHFATPRRLAVFIRDVETLQHSQKIFKRGPACAGSIDNEGNPGPALQGFARSCGVSVSELAKTNTDKGDWWVFESVKEGEQTVNLLPDIIRECISNLPITKLMRWGNSDSEFARPVHWAILLFGQEVIKTEILGVTTSNQSYGHRFHYPKTITITEPRSYESLLKDVFVIADFNLRRQMISEQVQKLALEQRAVPVMPEALLNEVTSIVEWPVALLANFDSEFLEVPQEVLIASMQSHQKCFALQDSLQKLLPYFITVANIDSQDPQQVILGNEKVMRARLSDAAFFYRQDKHKPLSDYHQATANVIYQAKLGSLLDKSKRLQIMMECFISPLQLDKTLAFRAAQLSKCDLMTGMVGEFPELQGLMGYYYALNNGEAQALAVALNEQYMPRFAADGLPKTNLGLALSIADRLDTLVGIFSIGQKPNGVKDPFKLRRHALAIVRMLILIPSELGLSDLIKASFQTYGNQIQPSQNMDQDIIEFIFERLPSFYQAQGISIELIQAVRARQKDWLYDFDRRIKALVEFMHMPEASSLSAACKRVHNILQQNHIATDQDLSCNPELFQENAEMMLFEQVKYLEERVAPLYSKGHYKSILGELAGLRETVDVFFEQVMVMVEDPALKNNRLCLLKKLQALLQGVADISLLS